MNPVDRDLIEKTLRGQSEAYGELVLRYQDRLFNSILRITNDPEDTLDAVQDAFINGYQALATFKGDCEFFTWLYRIAFNAALAIKRKRWLVMSLQPGSESSLAIDPPDDDENGQPGAELERCEDEMVLYEAMAKLSAEHRAVLVMKDIDGMKYEQMAEVLEVPIGTIRSRLHRARLELRQTIEVINGDPRTDFELPAE